MSPKLAPPKVDYSAELELWTVYSAIMLKKGIDLDRVLMEWSVAQQQPPRDLVKTFRNSVTMGVFPKYWQLSLLHSATRLRLNEFGPDLWEIRENGGKRHEP